MMRRTVAALVIGLVAVACTDAGSDRGSGGAGVAGGSTTTVSTAPAVPCRSGGPCALGDVGPGGGVVYFVAPTPQWWGTYLEVARADWHGGTSDPLLKIGCDDVDFSFGVPFGDDLGDGRQNTATLLRTCTESLTAAAAVSAYRPLEGGATVADWYLPSLVEGTTLFAQRALVGDLPGFGTLTSSPGRRSDLGSGCGYCFRTAAFSPRTYQVYTSLLPRWYAYYVRPVHAFGPTNGAAAPTTPTTAGA